MKPDTGRHNISRRFRGFPPLLALLPLVLLFVACAQVAGPQGWAGPASSESVLIAPLEDDLLVALDLEADNERLWQFPSKNGDDAPDLLGLYGTPAIGQEMVFVGDYNDTLYALRLESGEIEWARRTGGSIVGGPAVDGDTVYVGSSDRCLYAVEIEDGDLRWEPFCTGGKIWSSPRVNGGVVYVGSMDKRLYAVDATTGELRWEFKAQAPVTSTPVIDGGRVYVGSLNSKFYALDAASGEVVWSFSGDDWFWNEAAISREAVFVGNLGGRVYALDRESGDPAWDAPFEAEGGIRAAPVLVDETLVVADDGGGIYGISAATGKELWSKEAGSDILGDLLVREGTVYAVTRGGTVLAVDPADGGISRVARAGAD